MKIMEDRKSKCVTLTMTQQEWLDVTLHSNYVTAKGDEITTWAHVPFLECKSVDSEWKQLEPPL